MQAYGQPKHRRSESKNGLKETFLDKPTSKKGPATRWLVIALLSVFFIGLVYMAAEYNHTRNKVCLELYAANVCRPWCSCATGPRLLP